MPHELPKSYEPGAIETRWADYWIKEKLFSVPTPPPGESRPVFTLLLPPPNVTGRLHMTGGLPVSWMAESNVKFVVRVFFPITRHASNGEGCERCQDGGQQ